MVSVKSIIFTIAAFMASSAIAADLGPPPNCTQTSTLQGTMTVGFCLCTDTVETSLPSSVTVYSTTTITNTYTTVTVTPVSVTQTSTSILRGTLCFPSDPASPSS